MNYATIKYCDIANGEGVRTSLFVSGCRRHCPNCFNAVAWDFNYGAPFTDAVKEQIIESLAPGYINGLSLLGGEPLEPENQRALLPFIKEVKARCPGKTIWCYTGNNLEHEVWQPGCGRCEVTDEFLQYIDVLVDGEFVQDKYDISLRFRGSSNQRIIDMNKTRAAGKIVLWQDDPILRITRCNGGGRGRIWSPLLRTARPRSRGRRYTARSPAVRSRLPSTRGPGMPGPYTSAIFQNRSNHHLLCPPPPNPNP